MTVKVRGALINEHTMEALSFMFNPQQLAVSIEVNWGKAAALGASYERLYYINTNNASINVTLVHDLRAYASRQVPAGVAPNTTSEKEIRRSFEHHRRYLLSFCYPRGSRNDTERRSPPSAIFIWPGYLAMRVILRSLQLTDREFDDQSRPIAFDANCTFEELRTYRLTSAAALRDGFLRAEAA